MDGFIAGRFGPLAAAAISVAGSVNEVVTKAETAFLHVPLSMLYVAIGGALFGVFLLPQKDAARVKFSPESNVGMSRQLLWLLLNAGALGAAVLGFAFLSSWTCQALWAVFSLNQDALVPTTGIVSVFIRPLLPTYLRGLDALTSRILGKGAP